MQPKYNDYPDIVIPAYLRGNGWADTSWHNDVTASSTRRVAHPTEELNVVVWVFDDDPIKREMGNVKFMVTATHDGDQLTEHPELFYRETDDESRLPRLVSEVEENLAHAYKIRD